MSSNFNASSVSVGEIDSSAAQPDAQLNVADSNQPQRSTSNPSSGVTGSVALDSNRLAGAAAIEFSFSGSQQNLSGGEGVAAARVGETMSQESVFALGHENPVESANPSIRYSSIDPVTSNEKNNELPLPSSSVYSLQGYSSAESAYGSTQQTLASSEPSTSATLYKQGMVKKAVGAAAASPDPQSVAGVGGAFIASVQSGNASASVGVSGAFQKGSTENPTPAVFYTPGHGDGQDTPSRHNQQQAHPNAAASFSSASGVAGGDRGVPTVTVGNVPQHQHRASPQSLFLLAANYAANNRSPTDSTHKSSVSGTPYEESSRRVSCVIISEEYLVAPPQTSSVRYIEVPMVEETQKRIPRREVVEVEKFVPKYEVEYVERLVSTPCVQYIEKTVEMPVYQDIIVQSPTLQKQIVEVPREIIKTVPKIETIIVEKIVNVPGEVIEVPKPFAVNRDISKRIYADRETPVVVAQTVRQSVTEAPEMRDLVTFAYEPEITYFDVPVLKFVQTLAVEPTQNHQHQRVSIPAAHYNSLLKSLNTHLREEDLPYLKDGNQTFILAPHEAPGFCFPTGDLCIAGGTVPHLSEELLGRHRHGSVSTLKSSPSQTRAKAIRPNGGAITGSMSSRSSLHSRSSYNHPGGHSSHKISMRGSTAALSATMNLSRSATRGSQAVQNIVGAGSVKSSARELQQRGEMQHMQRGVDGEIVATPHTDKSGLSKSPSQVTGGVSKGTHRKTKNMKVSPKRCARCCVCVA